MLRTRALLDQAWRTPMIKFKGRERWHTGSESPTPHPGAPQDVIDNFSNFRTELQATSRPGGDDLGHNPREAENSLSKIGKMPGETYDPKREGLPDYDYEDFWEAPAKYWRKVPITEAEMALVESGGAVSDPSWLSGFQTGA